MYPHPDLHFQRSLGEEESAQEPKSGVVQDEEWIQVPLGGRLQVQRNGHSATVHIWRRTAVEALSNAIVGKSISSTSQSNGIRRVAQEQFSSEREIERESDVYMPNVKRSRIMATSAAQKAHFPLSSVMTTPNRLEHETPHMPVKSADQLSSLLSSSLNIPFNPLDEPSPLGLTLRKTPSLVNLVQMKLGQDEPQQLDVPSQERENIARKSSIISVSQQEKPKAANFPASILKIGTWEWVSRHEGDLVAKCYYAKRKLVWEVLEKRLKSKLEIQWSDITALKASCPDNEPGVLEIEVSRPPLFFKETNPQPRKHTLWQATSDFTGGQANLCKWHYLKFSPGLLTRHYEKLMQSDPRLKSLSEKSVLRSGPAYLKRQSKKVEGHHEQGHFQLPRSGGSHPVMQLENYSNERLPPFSSFETVLGSAEMHHIGFAPKLEPVEVEDRMTRLIAEGSSLTNSAMDLQGYEDSASNGEKEVLGFVELMGGSTNVNYTDNTSAADGLLVQQLLPDALFSKSVGIQRSSSSISAASGITQNFSRKIFNESPHHLLKESPFPAAFYEKAKYGKSNSPSSLIQMDVRNFSNFPVPHVLVSSVPFSSIQPSTHNSLQRRDGHAEQQANAYVGGVKPVKQPFGELMKTSLESSMSRISKCESQGDLLRNLPHLSSLQQFFDPALHGLFTCHELPRSCGDVEYS